MFQDIFAALHAWAHASTPPTQDVVPSNDGTHRFVVRDGYKVVEVKGAPLGKVAHVFGDIPSLARWCVRHADPSRTHVLVDVNRVAAGVDPRDLTADVVTMPWVTHPRLQPWLAATREELTITKLHALFRENRKSIVGFTEKMLSDVASCTMLDEGKTEVQMDHKTGSVTMVGASNQISMRGAVPTEIMISTPRWLGAGNTEYEQPVLLRWRKASSGLAMFTLILPELAEVDQLALAAAADLLRLQLPEGWDVGVGSYQVLQESRSLAYPASDDWRMRSRGGTTAPPPIECYQPEIAAPEASAE